MRKPIYLSILALFMLLNCNKKKEEINNSEKRRQIYLDVSPCSEYKIIGSDQAKRKIMKETINYFLAEHCFINNRGYVKLFISADTNGNKVWTLYPEIEDTHIWGSLPSPFYEVFSGDIVLVYKEDHDSLVKKMSEKGKQEIRRCADKIIGNRVYQMPTRKDRWTNFDYGPNIENPTGMNRGYTGSPCVRKIVFYKDGTHKILL